MSFLISCLTIYYCGINKEQGTHKGRTKRKPGAQSQNLKP